MNPQLAASAFKDPRMIQVMGVLMGIDMQGFARPGGSDEVPQGFEPSSPVPPTHLPPPLIIQHLPNPPLLANTSLLRRPHRSQLMHPCLGQERMTKRRRIRPKH
ncbi:uncharacterized protein EI90DRAFT_397970 [Cantharellus anzutake]|uniref:uncharacterized protein n=1 Tax=Cantharellus anzutake TaxID=1750568 RepID=UPI00190444E4|nr:uncharacterized protein EI90DRAFT_397970 [Cantharellus anzutake]KAF8335078.1 hypothetical protein EI90DRAFT_397970 [Cantharellus anzutake]